MSDLEVQAPVAGKYHKSPSRLVSSLTDFACYLVVALPVAYLRLAGSPYKRGFFCDDESITLPHKPETISNGKLAVICLFIPALAITIVEATHYAMKKHQYQNNKQSSFISRLRSNTFINNSMKVFAVFLFGALTTLLLTDIGKFSLGVLRPHFLSVCQLNWTRINCSEGYITTAVCEGDPGIIRTARLSFPSGHASLSAFAMGFLVLYTETRVHISWSTFLKLTLQLVAVVFAMLCGYSRIFDNMHHWSDVLAGFALGAVLAIIFACPVYSRVCKPTTRSEECKLNDEERHDNNANDNNLVSGSEQCVVSLEHFTYDSDGSTKNSVLHDDMN